MDFTIGIVGGMGSYATVDFFKRIVDAFPGERESDRPHIIVDNYCTMPARVRAILYHEKREELIDDLTRSVRKLIDDKGYNCDVVVLACNTSHVFLPNIIENLSNAQYKILNIIEECAKGIYLEGIYSVVLVGSEGTIETKIYDEYCCKYGISVMAPDKVQYERLRSFIEAVKQNSITKMVLKDFWSFIESFEQSSIILGCTELPILYQKCLDGGYIFSKKIFDPLEAVIVKLKEMSNTKQLYK